jgi:hypothetical protein
VAVALRRAHEPVVAAVERARRLGAQRFEGPDADEHRCRLSSASDLDLLAGLDLVDEASEVVAHFSEGELSCHRRRMVP